MYNYTETECSNKSKLKAHCKFINRIGDKVNSRSIKLRLISGKKKVTV